MSKKQKKKQSKQDDQMWEQKQKQFEKKTSRIKVELDDFDPDSFGDEKAFEFNFDHQKQFIEKQKQLDKKETERKKLLQLLKQQQEQLEQQEKPLPSDADLAQKADRKQKQKKRKQKKQKLKEERKQAQKLLQAIQLEKKKESQKLVEIAKAQYKKQRQSQSKDGVKIVLGLLLFIFLAGYLQYKGEVHQRYQSFRVQGSQNLYDLLEADSGLSDQQLKQRYKKLVLKYHPDKNKNCTNCKEHFTKIAKAWEILGNSQKRQAYDENNGIITKIKSKSITLTPLNYYEQVQASNDLWLVQVYDSTSQYCHQYSQFWEQIITLYDGFAKFGRIDIWNQNDMRDFVPYSFTIFPSIYSIRKDKNTDIYSIDSRRPIQSLKQFIQKEISKQIQIMTIDITTLNQKLSSLKKPIIVMNRHFGYQLKSILSKYTNEIDAYILSNKDAKFEASEVRVYYNSSTYDKYTLKKSADFLQFSKEVPKYFLQKMSVCQMIKFCQDITCALILNRTQVSNTKFKYPQIQVESDKQFSFKINQVKQKFGFNQNFELAIYQNGKIQFGNLEDIDIMSIEQGEIIDVECIPTKKIPYWSLIKVGFVLLAILYTSNKKIRIVLGIIAAYLVYCLF